MEGGRCRDPRRQVAPRPRGHGGGASTKIQFRRPQCKKILAVRLKMERAYDQECWQIGPAALRVFVPALHEDGVVEMPVASDAGFKGVRQAGFFYCLGNRDAGDLDEEGNVGTGATKVGTPLGAGWAFPLQVFIRLDGNTPGLEQATNSGLTECRLEITVSQFLPVPQVLRIKGREPGTMFYLQLGPCWTRLQRDFHVFCPLKMITVCFVDPITMTRQLTFLFTCFVRRHSL